MQSNKKKNSVKMQPRKVKKLKPHGAPKRSGGPAEIDHVPLPPHLSVGLLPWFYS